MTDERILVVCAANVCRSPLAELALRRGLGEDAPVTVISAGVRANAGDPICGLVASLHDDEEWREAVAAHRAQAVTIELIKQSTLVLAASREIRGELVRLAPRSRDSMFTIKEAAHLGAGFLAPASDRMTDYVQHLDRARSRSVPMAEHDGAPAGLRRFFGRRSSGDPTSIADRHGTRGHRHTVTEVDAAVSTVVAQLTGHRRHAS